MKQPTINRRHFNSLGLLGLTAGVGLGTSAQAQGGPVEGQHYQKLAQQVPVAASGKIDVVEFFWYGCPHCYALEPFVEQWSSKVAGDINFRRVPVGFGPQHEFHQKVFYTLEALGQLGALHRKFFDSIHKDHKRMNTEGEVVAFATANGLDGAKFAETMKSFTVIGKVRQAKQLADAYHVDGVPTIGVQGRFTTSASMAGGAEQTFRVVDFLVDKARKPA
ncbi:thiol:disulfide interchange protein DsbA/DsbL [Ideonella sp. DXS29W]|uniref:Thiol:disulfide interchange protein n=1 Tax=Ideonella lacteola TaxID=2984193 RepID=A0ABU9BLL3_9BURK